MHNTLAHLEMRSDVQNSTTPLTTSIWEISETQETLETQGVRMEEGEQ